MGCLTSTIWPPKDSGVIVVSEHWLWPYEDYKLDEAHDGFKSIHMCDRRNQTIQT